MMSILDPLRTPRASRLRGTLAISALLLALTLSLAGLLSAKLAAVWLIGGAAIGASVIGGTLLYLSRQSRLRTLLPQANEAMRRVDMARTIGSAVAVMIEGHAEAARDGQDTATLRRHAAKAATHWEGLSDRWLRP